jgi:hypothetical protein
VIHSLTKICAFINIFYPCLDYLKKVLRRILMNNFYKSHKLALGIAVVFVLMAILATGCSQPSSGNGVISEVTMCTAVDSDNRPINPTTVFSADTQNLILSFRISGFPVDTKLEVQWIYIGGDPEAEALTGKNYVAETQTATVTKKGSGYTATMYSRPGIAGYETWPTGDYKVVINVDGVEKGSTYFKIQ